MSDERIESEEEYREKLAEVGRLWGMPLGTPERDRLDLLIKLVEEYEDIHYPIGEPTITVVDNGPGIFKHLLEMRNRNE